MLLAELRSTCNSGCWWRMGPESVGDDLVGSTPRARTRDRSGADAPIAVAQAPVAVDRPEVTFGILNEEDVPGVLFGPPMFLKEGEYQTERSLSRLLTAELCHDWVGCRCPEYPVNAEGGCGDLGLDPTVNQLPYVAVHIADRDIGAMPLLLRCDPEVSGDVEDRDDWEGDGRKLLEQIPGLLLAEEHLQLSQPLGTFFARQLLVQVL